MLNKEPVSTRRFVKTLLLTIIIIVIFAYGFQVTKIDLEEPKKERRQEQLVNVLRSLARPDLTEYESERLAIEAALLVPCPANQFNLPDLGRPGPRLKLSTNCTSPGSEITVKGQGFAPNEEIFLFFVPYAAEISKEVELPLLNEIIRADAEGNFSQAVKLRRDRTSEEPQKVRAVVNRPSGWPRPSESVYDTIEKIIETIFLALIATAFGTALSIPISFLSARNLMIQVTSTLGSLVTLMVAAPLGWAVGWWIYSALGGWGVELASGVNQASTGATLFASALFFLAVQVTASRANPSEWLNRLRSYGLGGLGLGGAALILGVVAGLGQRLGSVLAGVLGPLAFLGNFLFTLGDALAILLPLLGGIVGAFALVSLAGPASENFLRHTGKAMAGKIFTVVMAALAGVTLLGLLAALVVWLYELANPGYNIGLPALLGGLAFGLAALFLAPDRPMPTGLILYYSSRTILNALRAIEPLIMAIVFVVWVGIGPFAGVLALTLHTIASLGKLYSEQVENIAEGPIEAVTATGANRLQTIIYAVMPQIVPPYIAFTIYRWDINVRMSTIIGFAGGGGIGFLLQQNLNLLKYRQASVQMIAIAIVVASLDYVSAKIREKIV
jgi:phosphonate ABC transporter permease subunit PhnE